MSDASVSIGFVGAAGAGFATTGVDFLQVEKIEFDDEGNLILDTCVLLKDDEVDGDLIYAMFDVIIRHLGESYKELMKSIWA